MVYVFTVLSCMKMGWLRRLMLEDSSFGDTVFKLSPDLKELKLFGGEFANVPMQRICNPFWKDVLKHYRNCIQNVHQNIFMILCQNAYTIIPILLLTKGLFTSRTGLMLGLYLCTTYLNGK